MYPLSAIPIDASSLLHIASTRPPTGPFGSLPVVTIKLPWNPDLTEIPPLYLFVGLLLVTVLGLGVLYFHRNSSTET